MVINMALINQWLLRALSFRCLVMGAFNHNHLILALQQRKMTVDLLKAVLVPIPHSPRVKGEVSHQCHPMQPMRALGYSRMMAGKLLTLDWF